jgi:phenylalanyl-tRNA synthetase beta chain
VRPTWRSDLIGVAELVEEVARFTGYDNIPALLPTAREGSGLTSRQHLRRKISRSLAYGGMVEVLNYPFVGPADHDAQLIPADDWRRNAVQLANPLSAEQPEMRTSLLGPLLLAAKRNVGRGMRDLAIYEMGIVTLPSVSGEAAGQPGIERRPSDAELAQINAAVPQQFESVAGVLVGQRLLSGPHTSGRPVSWADAIAIARGVGETAGVELSVRAEEKAPWHPGRCAALLLRDEVVGYAGELHPKVADTYGLPRASAIFELWLEPLYTEQPGPVAATPVRTFPVALQDLAFVTPNHVTAAAMQAALAAALGDVCESVRCFDVYSGDQVPAGHRSLAFALRLRAPDRTLSEAEIAEYRDKAVAAGTALGGTLR